MCVCGVGVMCFVIGMCLIGYPFFIVYIDRTQMCTVLHASTVCFSRPTLYTVCVI